MASGVAASSVWASVVLFCRHRLPIWLQPQALRSSLPVYTPGSYPLMDVAYGRIGGVPFGVAMRVMATVISASHRGRVTVDAGFKAFSTDRPFGPEAVGVAGARWEWAGDEHGFVFAEELPGMGGTIEFVAPHCDPTVNLHEKMYACRGEDVVEVWTR